MDRSLKTVVMDVKRNFDVHSINTRHKADLFPPTSSLSKYHKGVYYSEIKFFNHLPQHIKQLSCNINTFTAIVDLSRSNFSIARTPLFQLKSAM